MKNTSLNRSALWVANIALIIIMASLALPLLKVAFAVSRIVFAIGAALYLVARLALLNAYSDEPLRARRLHRLEIWSAIFFAVAAVMMWLRQVPTSDSIAFTLAAAALVVYSSLALSKALKD